MKVINQEGKIVEVTEKMFNIVYKHKGFKEIELTNRQIMKELDKRGIEYSKRDNKSELLSKLEGGK